jgi:hypothetical protein
MHMTALLTHIPSIFRVKIATLVCCEHAPCCTAQLEALLHCRKWDSQLNGILQMCKTVFILIVLGVGALLFSADANRLVLIPVDRMVQRVKSMADNPRLFTKA